MRSILVIGLMFLYMLAPAQAYKRASGPEQEIASYLKTANDSLKSNLNHTIWATQKAIDLAKANHLPQSEQRCYIALAGFYKQYDKVDFVVRNYDRAIALGLPNSNALQYQKLPFLERYSDTQKAIKDAEAIVKLAKKEKNKEQESNALVVLGNLHGKLGNYDLSLKYLEEAEQLLGKENIVQQAYVQSNIGDNYSKRNQNRKAEQYYRNAFDIGNQTQDTVLIEQNFDRLNGIYQQEKRSGDLIAFNNAITKRGGDSKEVLPDNNANNWSEKVLGKANLNLANAHLDNNNSQEAIEILEELKEDLPKSDLMQSSQVHKLLSKAYDQRGEFDRALQEYRSYVAIQDSLLKDKDDQLAKAIQQSIDLQELENHIIFLEKDKEINSTTISLNESNLRFQRTIIFAAIAIVLIVLVSLIVVMRKNRAKSVAYNLLELKSLRTKMNPHFIFNSLNSVNHFIAQNDEKAANRYLSQFSKLMREVLDSSDKDFIPLEKEVELLKVYLALEHQRFENKFEYKLDIAPEVLNQDHQVPPMLVQPFIENAIWHGLRYIDYPGKLQVRISERGGELCIEIEDNGIGREASKALKTRTQTQHKSSGISNSQSRVELINRVYGAAIDIQIQDKAQENPGTLVSITLKQQHGN